MRSVGLLLLLVACGSEEPRELRPPGGGGNTGNEQAPDASDDDIDADGDAGGTIPVTGRVCLIDDFQDPFQCDDVPLARDVLIEQVGGGSTRSDATSEFELLVTQLPALIDVGGEAGDTLFPTRSSISDDTDVDLPVLDELLLEDSLTVLLETLSDGAMLVYVVDAVGPVVGATVEPTAGGRVYYDDGVGGWDGNATTTGPDGIALVLDTSTGTVSAAEGTRSAVETIETAPQTIGIGVITLATE